MHATARLDAGRALSEQTPSCPGRLYTQAVTQPSPPGAGDRGGPPRDRHGRGSRGPFVLAGPLSGSVPHDVSRRAQFDDIVLGLVDGHLERWGKDLADVEFGIEDVPDIPPDWGDEPVPFGALTRAKTGAPARIIVFRRPVEMRAKTRIERVALVDEVLVENIAALLGKEPGEVGR